MNNVIRVEYLDKIQVLKDQNLIKVITGIRRSGKSTILKQFQEKILAENQEVSVISLNFELPEYRFLAEKNWKEVYDFIYHLLRPNDKNYVFLDEVQNVNQFEKLLEGLFATVNIDLYVTGSNAYLLSSELATLLTGRAFEVHVLPFSFAEYLLFKGNPENKLKAFEEYLISGGFPEAVKLSIANVSFAHQYIYQVFQNIYQNDILKRHSIYHEDSYKRLVHFLIDSVGSIVSSSKIANTMTSNGHKITNKSIAQYINTLVDSFLFYKTDRYDIKGKQYLSTLEKYYMVDVALRSALLGKEEKMDRGHILENIVYLELLRRHHKVWVGKVEQLEVDFVVHTKEGYTQYIQVAQTVQNPETLSRELKPLNKISDHHEKIMITMDYDTSTYNGIRKINIIDWLLGE